MRILLFIDSLGSGGAQRQIVNLACGFKDRGYDVEILTYHPESHFFKPILDDHNIYIHSLPDKRVSPLKFTFKLIKLIRFSHFHTVISFLDAPNFYAEVAKFISFSNINLIVSERSSVYVESFRLFNKFKRFFHFFANHVVANSRSHFEYLSSIPFLSCKTVCIYNGYDTTLFDFHLPPFWDPITEEVTFLVVGRIDQNKNGSNILKGLILFYQKYGRCPRLRWAGTQLNDLSSSKERHLMNQLLDKYPEIRSKWSFLGEVKNIASLLSESHALLHVSFCEGLSNAVCEALMSGRPVIASSISDHPSLVQDGVRGFLCDPSSPSSICTAIEKLYSLTSFRYSKMCRDSRIYAESVLSLDRMISQYNSLLV